MTEVAYVVSPNWGHYLYVSLHTLIKSGTSVDSIRIFCVGPIPRSWSFSDPRIELVEVDSLDADYFLINKTYSTSSSADRLIFLDADTIVLNNLSILWNRDNSDFIGRLASGYGRSGWRQERWEALLQRIGADSDKGYFNCGFFIFQNKSHSKIHHTWRQFTLGAVSKSLFDPLELGRVRPRNAEQIALSMAVSSENLTVTKMDSTGHSYGWTFDPHRSSVLYHTGSLGYFNFAATLDKLHGLDLSKPIITSANNRLFLQTQGYLNWSRIKMGLKKVLNGWAIERPPFP